MIKSVLLKIKRYVNARPTLEMYVMQVLNRFPGIKERIKQMIYQPQVIQQMPHENVCSQLSPHARQIYSVLKAAIEHKRKEKI